MFCPHGAHGSQWGEGQWIVVLLRTLQTASRQGNSAGLGPSVHPARGTLLNLSLTTFFQVPKHIFRVGSKSLLAVLIVKWRGIAKTAG